MNQPNLKTQFPEVFPTAKWTVIILINGENDLMKEVELAYNQLANVGSCLGDVNFVVVFDGLSVDETLNVMQRSCSTLDKSYPNVYYVTKYRNLTTTAQPYRSYRDRENLAKPGTLAFILKEVISSFPAEHFGFIYKGHGGAGRTDITSDIFRVDKVRRYTNETDEQLYLRLKGRASNNWELKDDTYYQLSQDSDVILALFRMTDREGYCELTYARLRDELNAAGFHGDRKLGFLCLDCCWGQILENAEIFYDTTAYFIGSSDEMPVMGIGYEEFADFLVKNRDIRPDEVANAIVAVFFKNNYDDYLSSPKWDKMGVSMTCVDMSKYIRVAPMMESLAQYLTANVEDLFLVISMARNVCMEYTNDLNPADYGMYNIDLIWFLENLRHFNNEIGRYSHSDNQAILAEKITALYQALYGDFQASHMASNYTSAPLGNLNIGGNGIALTFPKDAEELANSLYGRQVMSSLRIDVWADFLNAYIAVQEKLSVLNELDVFWCHREYLRRFYGIVDVDIAEKIATGYLAELKRIKRTRWLRMPGNGAMVGSSPLDVVYAAYQAEIRINGNGSGGKSPSGVNDDKKTALTLSGIMTTGDPGGKKTPAPVDGEKKTAAGLTTLRERK